MDNGKRYEYIRWMMEHLEYYEIGEEGIQIIDDFMKYGSNYYTYPLEAFETYKMIQSHFLNNPVWYMTLPVMVDNTKEYWFFANSIDGYFIDEKDEKGSYKVPIGYFREKQEENHFREIVMQYLEKWYREAKEGYNALSGKFEKGEEQYREKTVQAVSTAFGIDQKKFLSKESAENYFMEKKRKNYIIFFVYIILYLIPFCSLAGNLLIYLLSGIMITLFFVWKWIEILWLGMQIKRTNANLKQLISIQNQIKRISFVHADLNEFYEGKSIGSIYSINSKLNETEIYCILKEADTVYGKKIKIRYKLVDTCVFCFAMIILVILWKNAFFV